MKDRKKERLKELKIIEGQKTDQIQRGWYDYSSTIDSLKKRITLFSESSSNNTDYKKAQIFKAILMYIENQDISAIIKETGLSKSSTYNYIKKYKTDNYFAFKMYTRPKQNISRIAGYDSLIILDLEKKNVKTLKEAQRRIKELTGIEQSIPRIYDFFVKHNIKKVNGFYYQSSFNTNERIKLEKTFLDKHIDRVKQWVNDNHLSRVRGLATKIRKEFGIKYTSEYHLREWIRKNRIEAR